MGNNLTGIETRCNRLSVEDLSDLSGIDTQVLASKLENPRAFTLTEAADIAPHLGLSPLEFVTAVLA